MVNSLAIDQGKRRQQLADASIFYNRGAGNSREQIVYGPDPFRSSNIRMF